MTMTWGSEAPPIGGGARGAGGAGAKINLSVFVCVANFSEQSAITPPSAPPSQLPCQWPCPTSREPRRYSPSQTQTRHGERAQPKSTTHGGSKSPTHARLEML